MKIRMIFSYYKPSKMILKSFPSTTTPLHSTSINTLFFNTTIFYNKISYVNSSKPANFSAFGLRRNHHLKQTRLLPTLASIGSHGGDDRAMETVLRLYEAIKNKNLNEMSEIIGHDCLCVCNFISTFQTFRGKKNLHWKTPAIKIPVTILIELQQQVMEFFSSLMGNLGNKLEFVVQPTLHDGMTVGVSWKLECSKTHEPLGKGFSFHMCHIYQGKVLIRNVERFLEPLLHIQPLGLKMVAIVASITGQMASQAILKSEKKRAAAAAYVLCTLVALGMLYVVVMAL